MNTKDLPSLPETVAETSEPQAPAFPLATDYAPPHPRRPLASGNVYRFKGYARNGIRINAVAFRGHAEDDGAMEGVSVTWLNETRQRFWYPVASEQAFWALSIFSNACDPEFA